MKLKIFPWDCDEKPYWINPENNLEWYIDKSTTEWCSRWTPGELPKLNAIVFYVCERKDGKVNPLSRLLIDIKTNQVLADETSLENMAAKIDMLRLANKN